jgi:succinyl-CoA synthetase beta subunit
VLAPFDMPAVQRALILAGLDEYPALFECLQKLWTLFQTEKLVLVEVNPLFVLDTGEVVAGDAKVVRDEALEPPQEKSIIPLGGNIAVIASGGGASMLNIDILMRAGGKPANYVEYSGNPPASLVEELTKRVLAAPGIGGVWVVGGTANFTDLFETLSGFVAGLRTIDPKPLYPIVIRRDGPRQVEAKEMLEKVAKEEGFNLFVFGPETSMARSAEVLLQKMKNI